MKKFDKNLLITIAIVFPILGFAAPGAVFAASPAPIDLLSAGNFTILSETGITDVPSSIITGNIGASPITGAAIGVTCPEVTGTIYAVDATGPAPCAIANATLLATAVNDMKTAYTDAAGRVNPTATELGAGNIGGLTIAPGLYKWGTDVTIPTNVTLSGGASDVWIFQVAGNVTIASNTKVVLAGGALASHVFWQVGGGVGATLGTNSIFNGNILSAKQIVIQTGAVLNGRALAQTLVTLDHATVSVSTSSAPPPPPIACTLSALDFHIAMGNGKIIINKVIISADKKTASFTITNNTGCSCPVSLVSYKMFVNVWDPQWLSTQQFVDATSTTSGPATSAQTLSVTLPTCRFQVDALYGNAPTTLLDFNPYSYPNVPFVLAYNISPDPLCTNSSTATSSPPVITILGANPLDIVTNSPFVDPGATASDLKDGNITSKIIASSTVSTTTPGTYAVVYSVTDSSNLTATSTRVVNVADPVVVPITTATSSPPVITILGANPLDIVTNSPFVDPGATASDLKDGNITSKIIASSTVSTTTPGTYTVVYSVTDSSNLTATSTRVVNVADPVVVPTSQTSGGNTGYGVMSSGGSSSSYSGSIVSVPQVAPTVVTNVITNTSVVNTPSTCPLLYSYLRYGYNNNPVEVVKLQAFLKNLEGYNVDVNGVFDLKTLAGVNAFQTKYLVDVMGPWGASQSSGYVYITTKKMINEIACNSPFIITAAQQSIINAYKADQAAAVVKSYNIKPTSIPENSVSTTSPVIGLENASSSANVAVNNNSSNKLNTASVANASIFSRSWNFLKNLFSY